MRVTAWSNGRPTPTGAGYGIRVTYADRATHFGAADSIEVVVDGEVVPIKLSRTFWSTCPELRSSRIGAWLLREGLAPWPTRQPPALDLNVVEPGSRFRLTRSAA